uniref:Uncharacterized protein n=1 Tax=Paramoeba aestuarina TaxID=180227 RepID=A0A6U3BB03_9EUKA
MEVECGEDCLSHLISSDEISSLPSSSSSSSPPPPPSTAFSEEEDDSPLPLAPSIYSSMSPLLKLDIKSGLMSLTRAEDFPKDTFLIRFHLPN